MKYCIRCGSQAVDSNRESEHTELCDACFWRTQTETANKTIAKQDEEIKHLKEENVYLNALRSLHT